MTYHGQPDRPSKRILTVLVTVTIALVAYWAATGGFDQVGLSG